MVIFVGAIALGGDIGIPKSLMPTRLYSSEFINLMLVV